MRHDQLSIHAHTAHSKYTFGRVAPLDSLSVYPQGRVSTLRDRGQPVCVESTAGQDARGSVTL
jgi:hypothetical protein